MTAKEMFIQSLKVLGIYRSKEFIADSVFLKLTADINRMKGNYCKSLSRGNDLPSRWNWGMSDGYVYNSLKGHN